MFRKLPQVFNISKNNIYEHLFSNIYLYFTKLNTFVKHTTSAGFIFTYKPDNTILYMP